MNKVSNSAFSRLLTLRRATLGAAERIKSSDDYPDFFVEGSGPPWHEMWPEAARGEREFGAERMLFVDSLRMADDYPDFFVEGSGPAWHEMWPEAARGGDVFDPASVRQRLNAIAKLGVMQAYFQLRERTVESKGKR